MSLQVGQRVGSYEITALLGKGGMGEVYRARDTRLGRDVAIKILSHELTDHSGQLTRFEREARVLASLNHPNIGAIYGVEESRGGRALVLELVEGDTLAQKISGRLSIDQILSIARQIADALDVAHEKGIVHRDLKPANVKITPDGVVKVLDFGLAKLAMPSGSPPPSVNSDTVEPLTALGATEHGMILGTVAYMSPEQARGLTVDKRTDIWAFGCVLYEMLVGRAAFAGETTTDILGSIIGSGPDWSALPTSTPALIQRLLRRCLAKDPKERLRDIGDARTEIDETRTGATTITTASKTSRLPWLIASVAAVVAIAAVVTAWLYHVKPDNVTPRFSRIIPLTSGPARDLGPAISPDGKWVAYISNVGGQPDIWVKFVGGGEAVNLTAAANLEISATTSVGGLDISPDGTRIAVMAKTRSSTGAFSTWEIPAPLPGPPRKLLDDGFLGMRWSQDGRAIAFIHAGAAAGDALWVADPDGTNRREILPARDGIHIHWPTWSKDGLVYFIRTITTVANLDQVEIYRVNPKGGAEEPVVSTLRRAMHPVLIPNGAGLIYAANPTGVDLGLWWLPAAGKDAIRLTMGIGDYSEPRISADGRTLVATRYEVHQSLMRVTTTEGELGRITAVTDGYGGDLDPSVSPSGDRIVFSSSRTGERHLWTARIDGSELRQLTSGSGSDDRPAFSPDGKQIVFNSDRDGRHGIWLISADGGVPKKLADVRTTGGLSWSPDGSKVVYAAGAGGWPSLWTLSVDTGQVQAIAAAGAVGEPVWNPGRDLIAYMQALTNGPAFTRISFVNSAGQPQYTTLPPAPDISAGFSNGIAAWSPDGQRLAVVAQNTNTAASIWIVTPAANAPFRKLVELPVGPRIRGISWTRDGKAVIFGQHDSTGDIVLMDGGS
jgi:serine/threonine protein kinase/Tol biopolymer transport system component